MRSPARRLAWLFAPFVVSALALALFLTPTRPAGAATSGPVLVVVAHPDDEGLGMSGVIANAVAAGRPVYVAITTNGDQGGAGSSSTSYCGAATGAPAGAAQFGLRRDGESIGAMGELGLNWTTSLATSHVFFLGYPDAKLTQVASATSSITSDATGLHRTYARATDGSSSDSCNGDFGFLVSGQHSPLTGVALATDMDRLLAQVHPTDIYTHTTVEGHADHREVARQVTAAAARSGLNLTVHGTLIHPEGTDTCDATVYYLWPNPAGSPTSNPTARLAGNVDFAAPPSPTCSSSPTGTSWGSLGPPDEQLVVPASMQTSSEATNLKWQVISHYESQLNCTQSGGQWPFTCGFMHAFVKHDEIFWTEEFGGSSGIAYREAVLATAGLASYWRFGDATGTTAVAAAGPYPGTYSAVTLGQPSLLTGDDDPAAGYSGNAKTTIGDHYDFTGTAPFTLEAWVKPTTVDATARRIFSKEGSTGDGFYLVSTSSQVQFARIAGGTYQTVNGPPLAVNQRTYVTLTYDGATLRLYFNGAEVGSSTSTQSLADNTSSFTIGAKATGGGNWAGILDEPAVYSSALSAATVASHYQAGTSATPPPPDTTPPAKPATPTANPGDGSATVNLAPQNTEPDLASYTLQRKLTSQGAASWAAVKTGVTTWPQTDTGLTNGTSYDYRVIALDTTGNPSTPSDPVSVTPAGAPPDTTPPAKPATPTATAQDGAAQVGLSPLNTEPDLASYTLERKLTSQGAASWAPAKTGFTTWPQTDAGLTNGTSYDYRVIAVDTTGNPSTPSDPVSVTPAGAPPGAAYAPTVTGTPGLTGYWRFGDATGTTAAATTGLVTGTYGTGTTLNQPGLLAGDTNKAVTFSGNAKVTFGDAFDFTGNAPYSLEAWVKPTTIDATARRIFSKEATNEGYYLIADSTRLSFARIAGGGYQTMNGPKLTVGTTYHVVVTYDGATQRLYVNGVQVDVEAAATGLANNAAIFTVGAKASGGGNWAGTIDEPAVYSTALSPTAVSQHHIAGMSGTPPDTTPPAKPATPTATPGSGNAQIGLSPLNSEADLASYTLQRKLTSQGAASWANVQTGITSWPQTNGGLTNGTSYDYRVIAVDTSSNPSAPSDPVSVTPVAPPDTTPPAKPATPTATPLDASARINLSPLNTEGDLASYRLQRKLTSDPVSSFADVQTGITTWPQTNGGLTDETSYDFRVIAVDTTGNPSTPSDPVSVTPTATPPPDTTPPAKPATPTATPGNTTAQVGLSPLNSEPDLASYTLQRKLTSAADSTYAAVKTGVTSWPQTDTGLTNGTSYSYRVIALDTTGNPSAPSDAVAVTPTAGLAGYASTVTSTSGVSGYWRFGDATGSTAAATVGLVTGTYGAGTTLNQPGLLTGDANKAVTFSGNAKVTFGDVNDFAGNAQFSLEAWVKPTTVDTTARRIFSKEAASDGYYLISDSTRVSFARIAGGNYETMTGPKLTVGATYHVVVTYDGSTQRLYENGVQVDVDSSPQSLANTTAIFTVGAKASGGGNWAGTIDEPAVYTTVLSAATVSAHYLAGHG